MQIRLGAKVRGPEGELGTVDGMVPSRDLNHVEDFIVRHGTLMAQERQVPIVYVASVEKDGVVHLRADLPPVGKSLAITEEGYRAPDVDWNAPPSANDTYPMSGDFEVDATVARGAVGYASGKPGGYPGGEQVTSEDQKLPIIRQGTPIVDISGEQVGEVGDLIVNSEDGSIAQLTVRSGFIFKRARELPASAIRELTGEGIVLNLARGELEASENAA
jgi:uncharacterized protein YrrD